MKYYIIVIATIFIATACKSKVEEPLRPRFTIQAQPSGFGEPKMWLIIDNGTGKQYLYVNESALVPLNTTITTIPQ